MAECVQCGVELPPRAKSGPARSYCSGRCREAARRVRHARAFDWASGELRPAAFVTVQPAPRRKEPARKVDTELELLTETRALERRWRLQGEVGTDGLALRCGRMADGLRALLDELFGRVK